MEFELTDRSPLRHGDDGRSRIVFVLACALAACTGARGTASNPDETAASAVELREVANHPPLSLVVREGDPATGLAFALVHDADARASVGLAGLLARRLEKTTPRIDFQPHGFGVVARALARDATEARQFFAAITRALGTPVQKGESLSPSSSETLVRPRAWGSAADEAVGRCSGELGSTSKEAPNRGDVEAWREQAFTTATTAFAAVGSEDTLAEIEDALDETQEWPSGSEVDDEWPDADVVGVAPTALTPPGISVAVRDDDASAALAAALSLGSFRSTLSARLRAIEPPWSVDRVAAIARPRGACLRVDLYPHSEDAIPVERAAGIAVLALEELESTLARVPRSRFNLDTGIFRATDPREAAAVAAWRSLTERRSAGEQRRFVRFGVPDPRATEDVGKRFRTALAETERNWSKKTMDVVSRVEPGQGEFWLLLASPCGTGPESTADAGLSALMVRSVIGRRATRHGVKLEPWVAPEGVGLVAHAARQTPSESPRALSARVAAALGQALSATRIREDDAALSRAFMQGELGAERAGLFATVYEALAPAHPSWLDARGTWASVTQQTTHAIELERRAFVRGPLRVAVLANANADQVKTAATTLERWLRPLRTGASQCPSAPAVTTRIGEYSVETSDAPSDGERALVAVSFTPAPIRGTPQEAEWTVLLLNRPGGWLDQALRRPGLVSRAHASLLGGPNAGAIVIDVSTLDQKASQAVAQVRALLGRLSEGAARDRDAQLASRYFAELDRQMSLNPRHRLVEAWRSAPRSKGPNLKSLRRFHQSAFAEKRHVVVFEKAKSQ